MAYQPDIFELEKQWKAAQVETLVPTPIRRVAAAAATAIAAETRIGIDLASYEPVTKAAELRGWVHFIGAKIGEVDDRVIATQWNANMTVAPYIDTSWSDHCALAGELGVPLVGYVYDNPSYKMQWYGSNIKGHSNNEDPQILMMRRALKNKRIHAYCIDAERWFKFYNQYYAMIRGEISGAGVEKIPSLWIVDSARDFRDRIQEEIRVGNFAPAPIWIYFGNWFIDSYCPDLDTLVAQMIQWNVGYMPNAVAATLKSWTAVRDYAATMPKPAQKGNKWSEIQQITDKVVFPGSGIYYADGVTPHAVDVNRLNISDMTTIFAPGDWNGTIPDPITPPPPAAKKTFAVAKSTVLRMRTAPDTASAANIIAQPVKAVEFEVLDQKVVGTVTFGKTEVWVGLKDTSATDPELCKVTQR